MSRRACFLHTTDCSGSESLAAGPHVIGGRIDLERHGLASGAATDSGIILQCPVEVPLITWVECCCSLYLLSPSIDPRDKPRHDGSVSSIRDDPDGARHR